MYFISGPAHVMLLALRRLQRAGGPLSVSGRQLVLAMEPGAAPVFGVVFDVFRSFFFGMWLA